MKKRRAALFALVLAAGCDHGDSNTKPKLELNTETVRRLDAGADVGPYKSASSPPPQPVSSPAPPPPEYQGHSSAKPPRPIDAGVPDARVSPPTNQAPHAR